MNEERLADVSSPDAQEESESLNAEGANGEAEAMCSITFENDGIVIRCPDQVAVERLLNAMGNQRVSVETDQSE